jgi:hypothetical protein
MVLGANVAEGVQIWIHEHIIPHPICRSKPEDTFQRMIMALQTLKVLVGSMSYSTST